MAYQKLQVGTGVAVVKNNSINIPNVAGPSVSGTTDGVGTSQLIDSTASFDSNVLRYIVYNTTDGTASVVTKVESATPLTLKNDIMASGENYVLYADTNPGCVLYVGTGGDLRVLTSSGADLTFVGIPDGSFLPVQVKRVFSTDTVADNIIALW